MIRLVEFSDKPLVQTIPGRDAVRRAGDKEATDMRKILRLLLIILAVGCHGQALGVYGGSDSLGFYDAVVGLYKSIISNELNCQILNSFENELEFYSKDDVDDYFLAK